MGGQRNYGCRVLEYQLHGYVRIPVTLENRFLRVSVLAGKGADIFELLDKATDTDFMYRDSLGLDRLRGLIPTVATPQGSFWDYHVGGWYELFPNSGRATEHAGAPLGMHGEVLFLPWDYTIEEDHAESVRVVFRVRTRRTPFALERTLELVEDSPTLRVRETLRNLGARTAHFLWGHHITIGGGFLNGDCRISLPPCTVTKNPRYDSAFSRVAAVEGRATCMPGKDGAPIDVTRVLPPGSRVNEMLFVTELETPWWAIADPRRQVGLAVSWDARMFPCLWMWQEYNSIEAFPFYGQCYAVALEPQTTVVPMLGDAYGAGTAKGLDPGAAAETWLTASVFHGSGGVTGVSREGRVLYE